MLATEDPNAEPPLTEVLRHFEIAIDFT